MEVVTITRVNHQDKQTLGYMIYNGREVAKTLELPWKDNARRISCIPKGVYKVVRRNSAKYGEHFHISTVANRSLILIHNGNYHFQINGCILVGKDHKDINMDGYMDVTNSKPTMDRLLKTLPKSFKLEIV
jgi:hypothetical protein